MRNEISFVATGDYMQTRRIPERDAPEFKQVSELIHRADVRVTNLEIHISHNEGTPGPIPGGTYAQTQPDRLEDLLWYGFNLVGTANNHALDFNYDGLLLTNKYLDQYGILHAGTGENLYQAEKPVYLDAPGGRVAFLSVTTPMHKIHMATEQRRDIKGRPGVNGLRCRKKHVITKEHFDTLLSIAQNTEVSALYEMCVREGFAQPLPEGSMTFGTDMTGSPQIFQIGDCDTLETFPNESDLTRIVNTIDDAKRQADYAVINYHGHDMKGSDKSRSPDYLETVAHKLIDAGADAFVGHGPHVLRGIEIYHGRPIFYSLGNFIFQNETLDVMPQDFYDNNKIPADFLVTRSIDEKSNFGTKGLLYTREAMESVIPYWEMTNGALKKIELYPIELGCGKKRHQSGFPEITKSESILMSLKKLSAPYGTEIAIEEGKGVITVF